MFNINTLEGFDNYFRIKIHDILINEEIDLMHLHNYTEKELEEIVERGATKALKKFVSTHEMFDKNGKSVQIIENKCSMWRRMFVIMCIVSGALFSIPIFLFIMLTISSFA
jgi:hypothetical protein